MIKKNISGTNIKQIKKNKVVDIFKYSKLLFIFLLIFFLTNTSLVLAEHSQQYGAEFNPTGNPIGGGAGYSNIISSQDADFVVRNKAELLNSLKNAVYGQIIYVEDTAEIDLTGESGIGIPAGVILSSGRGRNSSQGALLFTNQISTNPLFKTEGADIRITGIRLRGPDPNVTLCENLDSSKWPYCEPVSEGILSFYANLEVDNCEVYAWSYVGIHLNEGSDDAYVHHNYIHHNQRWGLGYGVGINKVNPLIEANIFDWGRIAVAGTGLPGSGYEARYNIVLKNFYFHAFDMHGGGARPDNTNDAGTTINIHHNSVYTNPDEFILTSLPGSVRITGIPIDGCWIYNNWFFQENQETAVFQSIFEPSGWIKLSVFRKIHVSKNKFTPKTDSVFLIENIPNQIQIKNSKAVKLINLFQYFAGSTEYELIYKKSELNVNIKDGLLSFTPVSMFEGESSITIKAKNSLSSISDTFIVDVQNKGVSIDVPFSIMLGDVEQQPDTIVSGYFTIINKGSQILENVILTHSVASDYHFYLSFDEVIFDNSIKVGTISKNNSKIIYFMGYIPQDVVDGLIGKITVSSSTLKEDEQILVFIDIKKNRVIDNIVKEQNLVVENKMSEDSQKIQAESKQNNKEEDNLANRSNIKESFSDSVSYVILLIVLILFACIILITFWLFLIRRISH